ncbi:MAG TPA: complex I subunit 1 family protein [Anaeromyxobacteraceae bacterium]|nr:complex I subunit 1 family protein [Anaeromyxobacteraceae bacterium]
MRRFLGMVLFTVAVPIALVLLARIIYFVDGWAEYLGFSKIGLPAGYGAAIANVLVLMVGVVLNTAAALTIGERKWSAMIQNRIGPNRIRPFGLSMGGIFFLLADALKMITKENIEPSARSRVLYEIAPMAAFAPSFALFAVVPVGPPVDLHVGATVHRIALQVANIDAGLLFVFGAASLAVYGTALAGWSSNSKLAILGGVRASSQMISYEVSLGLSLVGAMMAFQSLRLEQMVEAQGRLLFGFLPSLGLFLQPLGLLIFFVSAFAETKRAPFDLPEGESEIVGYFVEYPGMKFGMMFLAEFIEVVVLAAITSTVFFGGWHPVFFEGYLRQTLSPTWFASVCAGSFLAKVLLLCWLQLVVRWTLPRFRFDQIQKLCWKMLLPVALGNVFLTGALILIDPTLELLAVVGLIELVAIIVITGAVSRRAEGAGRTAAAAAVAAAPH